ncbi:DUF1707 domain-containing protein [Nostocoides sp. F2B08]|uniref:DUF1707 domain-containing protein n=1 Tax=Nostocoides sp. F2B08 TaxID=2653936 RepID=UPI001262C706|nr:DUF1707 domain-containing protein [Tetrasphaera sp. F2B08]KAB7744238.1 DUF1707 domain-containing protein [Tetrasphaera sp. F2B08]
MNVDPLRLVTPEERVVAISLLRRAAEKGRLSDAELQRRLTAARQAQLVGGLAFALEGIDHFPFDAPTIEWPTLPAPPTSVVAEQNGRRPSVTLGHRPEEPLTVTAVFQSERIGGPWIVPPYLRLQALLSSVKIDCRRAHAAASTIDVEVRAGTMTVVVVVPPGWGAVAGAVSRDLGTLRLKVPQSPASGCPAVVFHGRLGITTLVVRHESAYDRWRDSPEVV